VRDSVHGEFGPHRLPRIAAIHHEPQLVGFSGNGLGNNFDGCGWQCSFVELMSELLSQAREDALLPPRRGDVEVGDSVRRDRTTGRIRPPRASIGSWPPKENNERRTTLLPRAYAGPPVSNPSNSVWRANLSA